jgi:hypothetical protein
MRNRRSPAGPMISLRTVAARARTATGLVTGPGGRQKLVPGYQPPSPAAPFQQQLPPPDVRHAGVPPAHSRHSPALTPPTGVTWKPAR